MNHSFKLIYIIVMALIAGLIITGCKKSDDTDLKLDAPKNVRINIEVRQMFVTWDAVQNASGYMIITTSEGCGSGNRTIDTKEGTAVATSNGNNALFDDKRNGAVQIKGETEIEITLMPEWNIPGDTSSGRNESKVHATAVTAKVMALGGTVSNNTYTDSDYSTVIKHTFSE